MKTVTLTGQFSSGNVKTNKFAKIEFLYDRDTNNFHLPALQDTSLPYTFITELNAQFGSEDWDCWEVIVQETFKGDWMYTGDYGNSDYIGQYNKDEW